FRYPISAIPFNTPITPHGPSALPGVYSIQVTANGQTLTQPLLIEMDPRVRISTAELARQFALSIKLVELLKQNFSVLLMVQAYQGDPDNVATKEEARILEERLRKINTDLATLYRIVEGADAGPTSQVVAATSEVALDLERALKDSAALNARPSGVQP
ncbi:MAG: hypothetical protein VX273_02715, partial [Acidobacteriota bacterium]|nr:hypothetical protein [Acidobacteriota bacterium]